MVRLGGYVRFVRWLIRRLGFRVARFYYFETDLRDREFELPSKIDVVIRRVPSEEVRERLEELGKFGLRSGRRGVARGDRCYFAEIDGQLAGYSWVSRHGISFGQYTLSPVVKEGVYSYLSFVFPDYRGNRLFACMLCHIYRELQAEGFQFACNMVTRTNMPSIRTRERFGAVGKPILVVQLPNLKPWLWGGPIGTGALINRRG
jgi:hypothetical protein